MVRKKKEEKDEAVNRNADDDDELHLDTRGNAEQTLREI